MALTLQQYASYLDSRDMPWPGPPEVDRPKAKPHLVKMPRIRCVTWSIYGTLLAIGQGELLFEHPQQFIMDVALDKTIQEFKMWASMVRKPGSPTDYLRHIYGNILAEQRMVPSGAEKHPEVQADRVWEAFIKKLMQKEYKFDAGFLGSLNEFSRKVAYFFHASLQGTACYPGAAEALRFVTEHGLSQGLLANTQCFTLVQLERGLQKQDPGANLDAWIDPDLRGLSHEVRARKPSERIFKPLLAALSKKGIAPDEVLHIGSRVPQDVVPARRWGMKVGLFAGDRASLEATAEQMKEPATRPDVLLTEPNQIADIVG